MKLPPEVLIRMFARLAAANLKQSDFHAWAGIVKEERENGFLGSYNPDGEKWRDLQEATKKRKSGAHTSTRFAKRKGGIYKSSRRKSKTPGSPLIDTGQLMKATIHATSKKGTVRLAQSRSAPTKSGPSISEIHDQGLGNNPQRRHWGIYKQARERIMEEFDKAIADVLKRAGF